MLVEAIRGEDQRHLITVGVIPWAAIWPNAKPLLHDPEVGRRLDFVSVHFYPEAEIEKALAALKVYNLGKPVVVEELFPLKCSGEQMERFIDGAGDLADGWISFYWGKPAAEYPKDELQGALIADWLRRSEKLHRLIEIVLGCSVPFVLRLRVKRSSNLSTIENAGPVPVHS